MVEKVSFKEMLNSIDAPLEIYAVPVLKILDLIQTPSTDATLEEAEKIWPILEASLDTSLGYGLAACQIGILKKIAFVKYNGKDYRLLNTRIIEKSGETIMYGEGCLSIPGKTANTIRYRQITVEDSVLGSIALDESTDGLLTMIFQHEVDHFEGITILDRQQKPIVKEAKISRNAPCLCGSGKKYKKCCYGS